MVKRAKRFTLQSLMNDRRTKMVGVPILVVIGGSVIILTVLSLFVVPKSEPGAKRGVGADGFQAYVEEGSDLKVKSVVARDDVEAAVGDRARSVSDGQVSRVFNYNGDRSQTLTFPFVRDDGVKATLYIDMKLYKNTQSLDDDHIYAATAKAGTINGFPAYYRHAQTIASDREYHMMVINGLKVYRFVVAQPVRDVTISEIDVAAILKKLATKSQL